MSSGALPAIDAGGPPARGPENTSHARAPTDQSRAGVTDRDALTETLTRPRLPSATPGEWLATHLTALYEPGADPHPGEPARAVPGWIRLAELLAEEGADLAALHRVLVAEGIPPKAAATYLAGWVAGEVAGAVGFGLVAAGAGFVVDGNQVRLHRHRRGWFDGVDLAHPAVLVTGGHPWDGQAGVETAAADEVLARTVGALLKACRPVIEACRALTPVGRAGLWNEVGDCLGTAIAHQGLVRATPGMAAVLEAVVRVPGVPWKATPSLSFVRSDVLGEVLVAQKGGCCLAYTKVQREPPDPADLSEAMRAFRARFPLGADQPRYCQTCSLRDRDESLDRQVFWRECAATLPTT